jgi:hypothetical protein
MCILGIKRDHAIDNAKFAMKLNIKDNELLDMNL